MTANKAILDYASRSRSRLLHDIYVMGKQEIDEGNKDSWQITPKIVTAAKPVNVRAADQPGGPPQGGGGGGGGGRGGRGAGGPAEFAKLFHNPEKRAARGYILPADQSDFLTATKFINTLINGGVTVQRATTRVHRRRKEISRRFLHREVGPGISATHLRHVRAAGSPGRFCGRLDHADTPL